MTSMTRDRATPNLPSRDFDLTATFYSGFGFETAFRDDRWMILTRGNVQLEFFPFPELDAAASSFMCCVRVGDVDALHEAIAASGVPLRTTGIPRLSEIYPDECRLRADHLIDLDSTQQSDREKPR